MEANAQGAMAGNYEPVMDSAESVLDTARNTASNAASMVAEKGQAALNAVKGKAGDVPGMIADKLEAGAGALRQGRTAPVDGMEGGYAAHAADTPMAQASERIASGMQSSADWLRDADVDKVKSALEQQVRDRPGRTLLIALGVGYLLGKAIRN